MTPRLLLFHVCITSGTDFKLQSVSASIYSIGHPIKTSFLSFYSQLFGILVLLICFEHQYHHLNIEDRSLQHHLLLLPSSSSSFPCFPLPFILFLSGCLLSFCSWSSWVHSSFSPLLVSPFIIETLRLIWYQNDCNACSSDSWSQWMQLHEDKILVSLTVCCFLFSLLDWTVLCSEDEERLVRDLFRDYNKLIRPVESMNETVQVEFGLNFIQLINVVRDSSLFLRTSYQSRETSVVSLSLLASWMFMRLQKKQWHTRQSKQRKIYDILLFL